MESPANADAERARQTARLEALLTLGMLDDLPRTGWLLAGVRPAESVAGHTLGALHLALALAPEVEPALDTGRVLALVAVHDAAEALLGDWPRATRELLPDGAKAAAERAAAERVLAPLAGHALALAEEYAAGTTREARLARLCDRLQLGVRLLAYRRAGHTGLDDFAATLHALDASEFAPAARLHGTLLAALDARGDAPRHR